MGRYKRENKKIIKKYMDVISPETNDLMIAQFAEGVQETAQDYADTIGEIPSVPTPVSDFSFFGVNERRMNALLDDMQQTEKKVSSATLRMMDDVYRQTLHKAELAMAAGATTLPNAIDMAVQDFLSAGITCIEYKNGRRVNIADYAEMALRTAATRAKLQGDAAMRAQLGVDTVLVSQYGQCSETCLPWQGRVYIDDVFGVWNGERSGDLGKSNDGNWYTLLSIAVAHGLFHPNCRHTLTTWYKGTSTMPKPMNPAQIKKNAALEQQQRALERKLKRAKRLEIGSTDPESIKKYSDQRKAAQRELHSFVADHPDILRRDPWKEKVYDALKPDSKGGTIQASGHEGDTDGYTKLIRVSHIDSKNIQAQLLGFANEYATADHEFSMVITKDGKTFLMEGQRSVVNTGLAGEENLAGSTIIHNHPVPQGETFDDSFSLEDFTFAAKTKAGTQYLVSGDQLHMFRITEDMTEEQAYDLYRQGTMAAYQNAIDHATSVEHTQLETMREISKINRGVIFHELRRGK